MGNRVMNRDLKTPTDHGIFDSGTTERFLLPNAPMIKKEPTTNLFHITLPGGCTILSTHSFLLDIPHLPITGQLAQIVPDLGHSYLIYVKQFCHAGDRVEHYATNFYIYFNNKIILQ